MAVQAGSTASSMVNRRNETRRNDGHEVMNVDSNNDDVIYDAPVVTAGCNDNNNSGGRHSKTTSLDAEAGDEDGDKMSDTGNGSPVQLHSTNHHGHTSVAAHC